MGSPQAPALPDPYRTAQAQTGTNIQTAIANTALGNADVIGPTGSTRYTQSGNQTITGPNGERYEIPRYTQTTTLSPEQQRLYDQQTQLGGNVNQLALDQTSRLSGILGRPVDFSGLPQIDVDGTAQGRARVEEALFNRINPQLERDRTALETKLVNQGFQRGTQAWNDALGDYNRQANDARLGITAQGLQEQQGQFGMQTANRSRAMQELLQERNQPINEITALMSGGQVSMPNTPQYQGGQVAPTDVMGSVYNSAALQNQQYQQQMAQQNAMLGGIFGLGSAGLFGGMRYGFNPMAWGSTGR